MRVLIDTHVLLWWADPGKHRIPRRVLDILENPKSDLVLSMASCWEAALKVDRLGILDDFGALIDRAIRDLRVSILAVEMKHVLVAARLPFHHRDPFDRMLLAQATAEGIPILTADRVMAMYPVTVIW